MKEIKLTQGKVAIVDDEDFEELSKYKWQYAGGYAVRAISRAFGKLPLTRIHVQIIGKIDGLEIDHINGDKLDNRRENLRHVTVSQNQYNRKPNRAGSSQYKGVSWYRAGKKWHSSIKTGGKTFHLGYYDIERDAAAAYNKSASELFGEYARLNNIKEEIQ